MLPGNIKEIDMNTDKPLSSAELLARVNISASERYRAEIALQRGEYLAELALRGLNAIRRALHGIRHDPRVKSSHGLGPTA